MTGRAGGWAWQAAVALVGLALAAAAAGDLWLHVGPTRPATFAGKRVAAGSAYRVSYTYAGGTGQPPSDTDRVGRDYFLRAHWGVPLRVRTFGVGTFRFARLAAAGDRWGDAAAAAARWAAVAAGVGGLAVVRRARRGPTPVPQSEHP